MSIKFISQRAFTILEVAIVLAIVGLLLAGGVNLMSASSDTAKYKQTQYDMQEVKETMLSFYNINKYLPCPDTDGDGVENPFPRTGTCTNIRGFLPHVTLGIGGAGDAWGERIKYQVTTDSSNFFTTAATGCGYVRPPAPTANTIRIQDLDTAATRYLGEFAAFSLISTGRNGRQTNSGMTGAFTNDGGCTGSGLNAREQENCDTDSILRYGNQMSDGQTVTFDDMVVWVGDYQLISELRKAGLCSSAGGGSGNNYDPTQDLVNPTVSHSGNYNSSDNIATSASDDRVKITGNMNKSLDLQGGNNAIQVTGNTTAAITAGSGDDGARIEGNVNQAIDLGSGSNSIYVGGNINSAISATGGSLSVYYDHATISSAEKARVQSGATLKCKISGSWQNCP